MYILYKPNVDDTNEGLVDNYIDLLVEGFKTNKNLPFAIKTKLCPEKNRYCKKKHGEIIVKSYNNDTDTFHLVYYSVHYPNPVFEYDQKEQVVHDMIKSSTNRNKHQKTCLLPISELKKLILWDNKKLNQAVKIRVSSQEKKLIEKIAKQKGMRLSAYIRSRLFS